VFNDAQVFARGHKDDLRNLIARGVIHKKFVMAFLNFHGISLI
jgi:hypothetical protein